MTKIVPFILLVLLNGCAVLSPGDGGIIGRFSQSRELSRATGLLESGDRGEAARVLSAICNSSGVPGVTDEALFRLALLSLRPVTDREGDLHALQLLKRLKKEYPASPWTAQAGQLTEMLATVEEMRRQNRNLKTLNQSLTNEVNELNNSIEQLKRLDLELEKKHR